jgi:NAD+ synthase (glutamine-hydrolysing)
MDFEGNTDRVIKSIKLAKAAGATFRTGPELEITYCPQLPCVETVLTRRVCRGYGCLDHFLENDTYLHSWEMLARIISDPDCQDILLDIGMYAAFEPFVLVQCIDDQACAASFRLL